jgi:hypothetical protein
MIGVSSMVRISLVNCLYILQSMWMIYFTFAWKLMWNNIGTALSQKLNVDFIGDAKWFVGIKFDWHTSSAGKISCRLSQEGFAATIVEAMGLTKANKSPMMTQFHSGFPIDAIPHVDKSTADCTPLMKQMQSWMGMINWLQQCTRPDITTTFPC